MFNIFTVLPNILESRMKASIKILGKTKLFLEEKNVSEGDFLNSRLAPDMLPFARQIQIMSDNAKGCISRLNNIENPKFDDSETSIDQLIERLNKTIIFVNQNPITDFQKAIEQTVSFGWMPGKYLSASDYVIQYLIPNFHFHATIAYAIARNAGVQLGKMDYIAELNLQDIS